VFTESSFVQVSAGVAHVCAVATGRAAYCWGAATAGQLGDRSTATAQALAQRAFSEEKLQELERLPTGLTVEHTPNPVKASDGGPSGRRYTWLYRTTVTSARSDTVTITDFGAFVWFGDRWVFTNFTGKPFTSQDFADWYACPDARILPGRECSDSRNWSGSDSLRAQRGRWYYIGVTGSGQRVKGEAIIEELAAVDTTKTP
jgi:hypothetical protein